MIKKLLLIFLILFPLKGFALASKLPHDGLIRLYSYHLDEFVTIQYLDQKGQWIQQSYDKLNSLLRSRGEGDIINMDKRLIELVDHLQDHFKADTIEVISGYRSPKFNKQLKDEGHHVANESYHTKGMAMDIHIDEINESVIRDYLLGLKLGGVGYYGDRLMVHVDFGPVRKWQGGRFYQNTGVGIFNKNTKIKIRTDRFYYLNNATLTLSYLNIKAQSRLTLQKFYRGKWVFVLDLRLGPKDLKIKTIKLDQLLSKSKTNLQYGKYRFRYKNAGNWQNSNEFYIKKQVGAL